MSHIVLVDDAVTVVVDVGNGISHVPLSVQVSNVVLGKPQSLWMVPVHALVTQSPFLGLTAVAEPIVRGLTPLPFYFWVGESVRVPVGSQSLAVYPSHSPEKDASTFAISASNLSLAQVLFEMPGLAVDDDAHIPPLTVPRQL